NRRKVRARADVDVEPGAREQLNRRVLQRAFRDAELERHRRAAPAAASAAVESRALKQVRWPVWQTLPSPSRFTFTSTVSSSQSTRISTTACLLPEVSPFIHSVLRVRLKNVAKPVRRVASSATSFMKPTIRTSELSASWMTAG